MRNQVLQEQRRIEEALAAIEDIARSVEHGDLRELGRLRRYLVREMLGHFHRMELDVYPTLLRYGSADAHERVAAMRAEGRELARAYRLHIARWNADNLLSDWETYRRASLDLIARMRAHFERSRQRIHPLLESLPLVLRDAA
jgi:hypothetical protein